MSTTVTLCFDNGLQLNPSIVNVDFELSAMKVLHFYSRSNRLLNFRFNGLQVVALMSVIVLSFVLSIRRQQLLTFVQTISKFTSVISNNTRKTRRYRNYKSIDMLHPVTKILYLYRCLEM